MAAERRVLSALERLRLHDATPLGSVDELNRTALTDTIGPGSLAAWRPLVETPPRRKSSALSLSHLTPATPPVRGANGETRLASDAVRDIERELEAVEARLSVFRERRETANDDSVEGAEGRSLSQDPTEKELIPVETQIATAVDLSSPVRVGKPPPLRMTQQAGEVADEVDHALATCDRLVQQAKLQASAASLTRSLQSRRGSQSTTNNGDKTPDMSRQPSALGTGDQLHLEATARALKALVKGHEREIAREEAMVRDQSQRTQDAQLQEMERKFQSKKKMALLTLREQCEAETRVVVQQAIASHTEGQHQAVATLQEQLLNDRERLLNGILTKHQADTKDQLQRLQVRLQTETLTQKQALEKQLQQELEDAIHQLQDETNEELKRWEHNQRLRMETELLTRREQAAQSILRRQEATTNELKQQLQQQHAANEATELEKLKKALAFGAHAQLQQLRKQLETDHEHKMKDLKMEAAQTLESKLADLRHVLTLAHTQETEKTQRELEKRHRVAVMETHEQLERQHHAEIAELTTKAGQELEATLAALRSELDQQNHAKLMALRQTMDRDHSVRLQQLSMEIDRDCAEALEKVCRQVAENNRLELDAKRSRMQQSKAVLMDEAVHFLSIKPEERNNGTRTTEGLLQLQQLQGQLPTALQRAVATLVRDFEELSDEQEILIEKISDTTGLYLTFKRQCGQLETEGCELRTALEALHGQLQAKDTLTKKLYMANEALLKKLGLADPVG